MLDVATTIGVDSQARVLWGRWLLLLSRFWVLRLQLLLLLTEAVVAAMKACQQRKRYSAHVFADSIIHWYSTTKQMPRGISANCSAVRDWALRTGVALRKLVLVSVEILSHL